MAGHPLRSATDRRLGKPLPYQLANQTRVHLVPPQFFTPYHAVLCAYAVLAAISSCCPPVQGRLPTRYSPVRHSVSLDSIRKLPRNRFVRLACVRHAASVHPEPGSNSHVKIWFCSKNRLASFLNRFYLVFVLNSSQFMADSFSLSFKKSSGSVYCSVFYSQGAPLLFSSNSVILSHCFLFVNNFFNLFFEVFSNFCAAFAATFIFYHTHFCLSRSFFNFLTFLLCVSRLVHSASIIITNDSTFVNNFFIFFCKFCFSCFFRYFQ